MSFSLYISMLAVTDTMALLVGKRGSDFLLNYWEREDILVVTHISTACAVPLCTLGEPHQVGQFATSSL